MEVIRIPKRITEDPPGIISGIDSEYIKAIGKLEDKLLILIDLDKILIMEDIKKLEAVA